MITAIREWVSRIFLKEDGGKNVINKKRSTKVALGLIFFGLGAEVLPSFWKSDLPPSGLMKSDVPLIKDDLGTKPKTQLASGETIGGVMDSAPKVRKSYKGPPIRYKARQVFSPDASQERIPTGANFVGKLLTAIDTRSPQMVSVMLPYGGSHRSGGGALPPETILIGQFSYSGQGERVFMVFSRAILPDGEELGIRAQALSSKDYRAGVIGDFHSNKGERMASVLGLSMVSGISEVMVEKEGLGQSYEATPKATLKNGFYNGLAKVTEDEATNRAAQLGQTPNYVTIDSGQDVIISLGESMRSNERNE